MLVGGNHGLTLPARNADRLDLGGEAPASAGLLAAPLGLDGIGVGGVAGDTRFDRQLLRRLAHDQAGERVVEAVLVHAIDDLVGAEAVAPARPGEQIGRVRHAFGAAGENDLGFAEEDRAGCRDHRLQSRAAGLIDGKRRSLDRNAGAEGYLTGAVGSAVGLAAVPEDHLVDERGLETGAPQTSGGRVRAEIGRGEPGESAAEFADRRSHRRDERQTACRSALRARRTEHHHLAVNCGVRFST